MTITRLLQQLYCEQTSASKNPIDRERERKTDTTHQTQGDVLLSFICEVKNER